MHEDPYEPLSEAELRSMASFYSNPTIRSVINDALYWRQRAEAAERRLDAANRRARQARAEAIEAREQLANPWGDH